MIKEAFAILQYQCSNCLRLDFIWNGTELSPPFSVECSTKNCCGVMSRVNWHELMKRKRYLVPTGARYFTVTTDEHARNMAYATLGAQAPEESILELVPKLLRANPVCLVLKVSTQGVRAAQQA